MTIQVTTGFGKAKSSNPVNNNGATVVNGGAATGGITPNVSNVISLGSIQSQVPYYGSNLTVSVSPGSSGNVGHGRAVTTAPFANFGTPNLPNFIISRVTTIIGGNANTALQSMGADTGQRRAIARFYDYQRRQITSLNLVYSAGGSGIATKGASDGLSVLASGLDGKTGQFADLSVNRGPYGIPFKYTLAYGGTAPSGVSITGRTNP